MIQRNRLPTLLYSQLLRNHWMRRISMLGAGLIGMFYTMSLHGRRSRDQVGVVYSRTGERARAFAEQWGVGRHTDSLQAAMRIRIRTRWWWLCRIICTRRR